ncbi:MAG: anthranilate phosphoribosyltransferase [Candidatus Omnitrophica bacterium]|nr:anthranilate phosphoribosyltransferase [Candidatus Omnitrophota bacterium]
MISEATELLTKRQNLNRAQMQSVMEEIMAGRTQTEQIISFLRALGDKGETVEELTAAVSVMRAHVTKIVTKHKVLLDTCGTGGDKSGTFNISTVVAFIASGCQITVAKHGNRCVSSRCGSADIFEALGININMSKERVEECLDNIGIAFLFAPNLHPAMKYAMPARKQIGKRTIFNILGPLSNPAGATNQLIGVFDKQLTEPLTRVLVNLGSRHVLVVHGEDGLDEITTTSSTYISEANKGEIKSYKVNPEDFGIDRAKPKELLGGDATVNAKILLDILSGEKGPKRDIAVLNSAAAIYAADQAESIKEAIKLANNSIDSKAALKKLEELKKFSGNN